jgi:hypothetical protein
MIDMGVGFSKPGTDPSGNPVTPEVMNKSSLPVSSSARSPTSPVSPPSPPVSPPSPPVTAGGRRRRGKKMTKKNRKHKRRH